jgi:hypothetical protein
MAGHRKPPAAGVRSAGGPIPGQYPLDADFCELSPPPTSGRRREDPVMCDQQATSASLRTAQIGGSVRRSQGIFVPLAALSSSRLRPNGRSASRIFIHRRAWGDRPHLPPTARSCRHEFRSLPGGRTSAVARPTRWSIRGSIASWEATEYLAAVCAGPHPPPGPVTPHRLASTWPPACTGTGPRARARHRRRPDTVARIALVVADESGSGSPIRRRAFR